MLANVLLTDTHKRLAAVDEISDYLKRDETNLEEFAEMDRFVSALAAWMGSSNFKVSLSLSKTDKIQRLLNRNVNGLYCDTMRSIYEQFVYFKLVLILCTVCV